MKIFTRLFPIVLIALMFNCSKSSSPSISIAGVWTGVSFATTGCTNASDNSSLTYVCPATTTNECFKITFNSNGTFTSQFWDIVTTGTQGTSTTSGTYSLKGNNITATSSSNGQTTTETDTFVVSGNTLTITSPKNSTTGCTNTTIFSK